MPTRPWFAGLMITSFGDGSAGQLGHNKSCVSLEAVSPVGLVGTPIARIAAGAAHSVRGMFGTAWRRKRFRRGKYHGSSDAARQP